MVLVHEDITETIIGAAYDVYNELGYGFLEKVYQNAMKIELERAGLKVEFEKPIQVWYKSELVGDYIADIVVEDKVIVELKSVKLLNVSHEVQLSNYLKATEIAVGLLINFGERIQIKRRIFDTSKIIRVNPC